MARTKSNPSTPPVGARKAAKTGTKKPLIKDRAAKKVGGKTVRKATPIRKTPVLKKAQPGAAVTLILSPENNGVTAGSLINSLRTLHPDAPVEFSSETFEQRMRSEEQAAKNAAMTRAIDSIGEGRAEIRVEPASGKAAGLDDVAREIGSRSAMASSTAPKPSAVDSLLRRIDIATDALHDAITEHAKAIGAVLAEDAHGEEAQDEAAYSPTGDSVLVTGLQNRLDRIAYAAGRIDRLSSLVQL